jgi:hypothetical protein
VSQWRQRRLFNWCHRPVFTRRRSEHGFFA